MAGGRGDVASPAILTASASGLRRAPWQVSQGCGGLVVAQLLAHPGAVGLEHAAVEIADDALERLVDARRSCGRPDEGEGDGLAAGAVQDDELHLAGQVVPGRVEAEAIFAGEAAEHLHVIGAGRVGLGPGDDRALLELTAPRWGRPAARRTAASRPGRRRPGRRPAAR